MSQLITREDFKFYHQSLKIMGNSCKLGFFGMLYFIKHDGTKHQEDAKPLIVDLNWTNHSVGQNGI